MTAKEYIEEAKKSDSCYLHIDGQKLNDLDADLLWTDMLQEVANVDGHVCEQNLSNITIHIFRAPGWQVRLSL